MNFLRATFKNSETFLWIRKNMEIQPKTNTQKFQFWIYRSVRKSLDPMLSLTVENKMGNLHKIRLFTFWTQWMRYSIMWIFQIFQILNMFSKILGKIKFWSHHELKGPDKNIALLTIWCITQAGNIWYENTSTTSLHSE